MEKLEEFISWFNRMGTTLDKHNYAMVEARLYTQPNLFESTLKRRAVEIKNKYNHIFQANNLRADFLKDVPDISTLKFERKK